MAARGRNGTKGAGQRDRLLARARPCVEYPVRVADPSAAQAELDRVRREFRQVRAKYEPGSDEHKAGQRKLKRAQGAVDACYETVAISAMSPVDYELLKALHPPTPEQLAAASEAGESQPDCDVATFVPEVLAAGCDNGMSAEDWTAFLAEHCSDGERQELRAVALAVNERPRFAESLLPKGLTGIPSSPWS